MISTITAGIETRIEVVVSGINKASYGIDLTQNSNQGSNKIYSVTPQGINDTVTITRAVTYDQSFHVQIGQGYINKSKTDEQQRDVATALLEHAKDIYKDLVNTNAGTPTTVMQVTDLDVADPIHETNNKLVVISMIFNIKYREAI